MTVESNKQAVARVYELLNSGHVQEVGDLVSPSYQEHDPLPGQGSGRDGALDRFAMITSGLAPRFTIDDVVAEGDRVVVRWTNVGTHIGEFAGVPPTGRTFSIGGIDIYRLADGVLCEHWDQVDQLGLLGQLGLLPAPSDA
jgi:predicted ester cyclase